MLPCYSEVMYAGGTWCLWHQLLTDMMQIESFIFVKT